MERGWFTAECSEVRGGNDYGRALALAAQVASAMAFLHANNIVHGVRRCQLLGCQNPHIDASHIASTRCQGSGLPGWRCSVHWACSCR